MKNNLKKNRGFTLIELMVVIAIISLVSSIILASIKQVREKAMINKTVAEMRSLQQAVELYRNQFGSYPGVDYDGVSDSQDMDGMVPFNTYGGTLESLFTSTLVNNKFISKIPHSPLYPNNLCNTGDWELCANSGYIIGYYRMVPDVTFYNLKCGSQKINNYVIYFMANSKKVNLPTLKYDPVNGAFAPFDVMYDVPTYCIGM